MRKKLDRDFFKKPALELSKDLLGKYLVRKIGRKELALHPNLGEELAGKIVETEAYVGPKDKASHAFGGKLTKRNGAEFLAGGHVYIYLIYGMYWQLNISASLEGRPECVLIRALEPKTKELKIANGPGKLCKWLLLDKSFDREDITASSRLWLEDRGEKIRPAEIAKFPRIGIDYAGPVWAKKPWRFCIKNNIYISRA